ncbi:MAG: pyruvate ferredoxin oxidoreductase [Candidatus Omnitrophota bacterium]|jgi:indolepyruvate ferredoxin oxidoreductase beta subunit|nr:MAG: pyruvate ferredoxin oxidoreductase [Candidatus Omnitrophota bacterium]
MKNQVINVIIAGLGGQGVLKASDILSDAVFRAGYDVKKSEIHGMSQRGGSVCSDVRFGKKVLSPMVPVGEADFLVVIAEDQVEVNRHQLRQSGVLIEPKLIDLKTLKNQKSLNVALLGILSRYLDIGEEHWKEAIRSNLPEKLHGVNFDTFTLGRSAKTD